MAPRNIDGDIHFYDVDIFDMNGVFFLPAIDRQRQGNDGDSVGGL